MSRKTSFVENSASCLKILNIIGLQSIRKFNKEERTENLLTDDEESVLIRSFFQNWHKSTLSEMRWDAPTFD